MEYPISIYRVYLNAELSRSAEPRPRVEVTKIPCKRTPKQYMTAHGRSIKRESIMQPTSNVDSRMLMEYVYCDSEDDVPKAIELLVDRARNRAADMLARATALQKSVDRQPLITMKDWIDER